MKRIRTECEMGKLSTDWLPMSEYRTSPVAPTVKLEPKPQRQVAVTTLRESADLSTKAALILMGIVFALSLIGREMILAKRETRERTEMKEKQKSAKTAAAIAAHKVLIGMRETEVRRAWGNPVRINRTPKADYVSEEVWIYDRESKDVYLYFDNSLLWSFQDSR